MKNTSALTIIISHFEIKVNMWYIFSMLEVDGLSYRTEEEESSRLILDKVSFGVSGGSFLVITGANGSGKSTLAKIIMGLKKQTSGKILWRNEEISSLSITERAKRGISFSFQQPVKFKGIKVYDLLNIAHGELISPEEAGEFLQKVGLSSKEYLNREVDNKLSGGELKRIEIASILAKGGELLIFDEPEAGIDLWSFDDLVKIFEGLKKLGKTIIVISHQERILKIADKIMVLEKGKVKEFNEARMILPKILGGFDGD